MSLPLRAWVLLIAAWGMTPSAWSATPQVIVVRRGWHIDVGFAAGDLEPPLRAIAGDLPEARYILFGFGDMRYLLAKHHGSSSLAAALWPGRGIMLVTGIKDTPAEGFGEEHVIALDLSADEARVLQRAVWQSFLAADGRVSIYRAGPYAGSFYYLATPTYSALHTCNTWAAEMLKDAGFKMSSGGTLFAGQLWRQVERLHRSADAGVPVAPPNARPRRP